MTTKEQLYAICLDKVKAKIDTIQNVINEARNAANNETKSSAGDKHETARAMLQLEQEKNAKQLLEAQKLFQVLQQLSPTPTTDKVKHGSIVITNKGKYYLSVSLGKINSNSTNYFAISPATPIGKLLLDKTVGEAIQFNEQSQTIQEIL